MTVNVNYVLKIKILVLKLKIYLNKIVKTLLKLLEDKNGCKYSSS
jgi:hypothetical protein